jgi:hypothetical protein
MRRLLIPAVSLGRQDPRHAEQDDDGRPDERSPQETSSCKAGEHAESSAIKPGSASLMAGVSF